MFSYDCADITYAVTWGKLDGSSDIDYSADLNKKEARIYTKARMLGQDLDEVMDTSRIEREIIRYERDEYDSDIRNARVSISFCENQEQPLEEDVKAYLRDLLAAHRVTLAHDVVEAQINFFGDAENDWEQIALDLAMEVNCPGYAKKYQDSKFNLSLWEQQREQYLKKHTEPEAVDRPKCGERFRMLKDSCIRRIRKDKIWYCKWPNMSYSSAEDKIKRLRGCELIGGPLSSNPCILTKSGEKVKVNTSRFFEPYFYGIGLCPYNAEPDAFSVKKYPDGGAYYDSRKLYPGKWGFIDTEGNVVIEPQYVYALGAFGPADKEFFVVARLVNKKTLWGVLDFNGNESIPCQYASIEDITSFGDVISSDGIRSNVGKPSDIVKYQEETDGLFGLMKIDGTVILPPMFGYLSDCHFSPEYNFVIAGDDLGYDGVFSLEKNRFVIPCTENSFMHHFCDETKTIKLVNTGKSTEVCYDYDGNKIG